VKHAKSGMGPHWPGWRSCVVALALCVSPAWGRDRVALKFVNADLDTVVRAVGQYTGRTFVIDPRVKGTLTLSTERSLSRAQAMAALTAALRLQGFALVEAGGVMRVVPEADAKFQGGVSEPGRCRRHRTVTSSSPRCSGSSTRQPPTCCRWCVRSCLRAIPSPPTPAETCLS